MKGNALRSSGVAIQCWLVLWVLLGIAGAEDCKKAREIYARGTALLNYEERLSAFQESARLCPSFAEAHCNHADACENLAALSRDDIGRFNQLLNSAIEGYGKALACNPRLFSAHLGLGDTYRVMGLYEHSEQAYRNALELRPDHPKALAGLEKIRLIKAQDRGGFKTSSYIVGHFRTSSTQGQMGSLMGFQSHTVVKDRLRFDNILFDEWSAELRRGEAMRQLEELGNALASEELSGCEFVVEGHTDNRGDYDRNMRLSWDRAESVKTYLVKRFNINEQRVRAQGFGYTRPRVPNDSQENMLKNRRVEIVFLDQSGVE